MLEKTSTSVRREHASGRIGRLVAGEKPDRGGDFASARLQASAEPRTSGSERHCPGATDALPGAVTIAVLPWSELIGGVPCPRSRWRDHEFRGSTAVDRETYAGHVC